jgi:hypothetical protein
MKQLFRLLALSLILVTVNSFAEMLEPPSDGPGDPVDFEFDVQASYVGEADVERGSRRISNFDEGNFLARFLVLPTTAVGILRLGAEYEIYDFDIAPGAQLPDKLQSLAFVIGLDTKFSDSLLIRVEAKPGLYFADDAGGEDFNVPLIIGGTYLYSSTLQFVFGIGVDYEGQYPVLPGGGVRWKFAPQWVLNATLPTPRLEYELNRSLTLYAGADLRWKNFRVDDDFTLAARQPGNLDNAILSYREIRAGAGVAWKIGEACKLSVEAGYMPYRQFDYHRADIRYKSDGGAPYGSVQLHAAF